jgi:hypothetical protein
MCPFPKICKRRLPCADYKRQFTGDAIAKTASHV